MIFSLLLFVIAIAAFFLVFLCVARSICKPVIVEGIYLLSHGKPPLEQNPKATQSIQIIERKSWNTIEVENLSLAEEVLDQLEQNGIREREFYFIEQNVCMIRWR